MAASRELLFPPTVLFFWLCSAASQVPPSEVKGNCPLVISTWPFREAVRAAWDAVENGLSAVDSVVEGCSACEDLRCDGTVGPGGSPDENGETALDAMVMDGITMEVGAVASLRFVKGAIRAAKLVLKHTQHTLLVGDQASAFALSMGLPGPTNLSSPESLKKWRKWKQNGCQPNFWKNVLPTSGCGPYHPMDITKMKSGHSICDSGSILGGVNLSSKQITHLNHDTISMAVIDKLGHIAVGTSTNGATFKIPGRSKKRIPPPMGVFLSPHSLQSRVGDGPIAGSSAYADQDVGACGATGDGDVMMRFLPCYQVVESMRQGMTPKHAALDAISRIKHKYPDFVGAVFAVNMQGIHAGACHGWTFQYSVISSYMDDVEVFTVSPENV